MKQNGTHVQCDIYHVFGNFNNIVRHNVAEYFEEHLKEVPHLIELSHGMAMTTETLCIPDKLIGDDTIQKWNGDQR